MSIRAQRKTRAKPPRGTIPLVIFEADAWDQQLQPLHKAHSAILKRIDALLAHPDYPRFQEWARAGAITEEPALQALLDELRAARAERVSIEQTLDTLWNHGRTIGHVPVYERPVAHPWTRLAIQLLAARYTGAPAPSNLAHMEEDEQREIVRHFARIFGVEVYEAWVLAVVAEIEGAALERQNASVREANLDAEQLERFAAAGPPTDPNAHATLVLGRSVEEMNSWAVRFDLPSWLDAPLTAYFIGRYGFERGGGAGRKISRTKLLKLLTSPDALSEDLEKSPATASAFATNLDIVRRREPITAHEAARP